MARLVFDDCQIVLNEGVDAFEVAHGQMADLFSSELSDKLRGTVDIQYDLSMDATLFIKLSNSKDQFLMLCIDGIDQIDALRRYCETALDDDSRLREKESRKEQ